MYLMYWRMYFVHAVRRACILAGAAWLCALPAAGQAIPDEGYPSKPVFPEESSAPPALHEECGAFLLADPVTPDAFAEECAGNAAGDRDNGLDGAGNGVAGAGSSSAALDPILRTPPRLECPSAVFLEEMETAAIDCHAYDAAGDEHLDYFWEPVGGATRDYLENPRLLPEDAPNPVVVAPSFPVYDTMESFLAEEGAQRYRYRLTATSRTTGLSSHAEVEVFVHSSQPSVYCPLELEVEEGDTVVLACEGADPLSFRMDASDASDEGVASPALWAWEGLWGSSTSPLAATDTPQPLFTAPSGSAGRTYHYVASLTTSSSGVPRTARRRVSVTVKAGEGVAAYSITCPDHTVYPSPWNFLIECTVSPEEPSGATYDWQTQSGGDAFYLGECPLDSIGCADIPKYQPVFYGRKLTVALQTKIKKEGMVFKYRVTMSAPGIDDVTEDFTLTFLKAPDLMDCKNEYMVTAGVDVDFQLDCKPKLSVEDKDPLWFWNRGPESTNTPPESMNLDKPWDKQNKRYHVPEFDATFLVPDALPAGKEIEVYQFYVCMFQWSPSIPNGLPRRYRIEEAEYITVTVKRKPDHDITVECLDSLYSVYAGEQEKPLTCTASGAPEGDTYTYDWKPLGTTPDTDLLSGPDIVSPIFTSPKALEKSDPQPKKYEYRLTVSSENANPGSADVTVEVWKRPAVVLTCPGNPYVAYEGDLPFTFDCKPSLDLPTHTYSWQAWGATTDMDQIPGDKTILNPTFEVPASVAGEETYEYRVIVEPARGSGDFKDITVTVRERLDAMVTCADESVYEGADPIALDCSVTTTLDESSLTYAWEAVGSPADTNPLENAAGPTPTFNVPAQVAMDEMHTYRLTVSMGGMEAAPAEVTVRVLDKPQIAVACVGNPYLAYEGAEEDITLDCSSPDDPDGSLYTYAWTARNAASDLDRVDPTNIPAPTFAVPEDVPQMTDYAYLLTVSGPNMEDGTVEVDVTVQNKAALALSCKDPAPVYEGADPIALNCTPSADPGLSDGASYAYSWASLGSASDADLLVAGAGGAPPTFEVPEDVAQTMQYEYVLTLSAANAEDATAEVTVTVLDTPQIVVACEDPDPVREGAEDITLSCEATGAPEGSAYAYTWAARTNARATPDTDLLRPTDVATPTFAVPADVSETTRYEYVLTATAANAKAGSAEVTVTVLDEGVMALVCTDPDPVYEGSADITLSCAATGAPEGSTYEYTWAPRGATPDTNLLSRADVASPMFAVPAEVDADETYEYTVTATAGDLEADPVEVSVTVLDKPQIVVACAAPDPVYEGSEDITLDCAASVEPGAPDPAAYTYVWTAGKGAGATVLVDRLIAGADGPTPTFNVPDDVPQTTQYEYTLTVTAEHAESGVAEVVVRVLDKPQIVVACAAPDPVYEGSEDITLDCAASVEPGAPDPAAYTYVWAAGKGAGATAPVDRLIAGADGPTPTFNVPDDVPQTMQYAYTLTVTAEDAEAGSAEVVVTVLDSRALVLTCANPDPVYEGSPDIALDCAATRDTGDATSSDYEYVWTARNTTGALASTDLLSAADIASPTFFVPEDVPQTTRYEYQVTVSAEHADPATAEVTVTVLNRGALALACAGNPYSAYEGSEDITLDCAASGEPGAPGALESSDYEYAWTPLNTTGATADMDLLSAADVASPTFAVPAAVDADETYEYLLTVSAENAEAATVEVTVKVLNKAALALACAGNPYSAYEGSEDILLDCSASGEPGAPGALERSDYEYAWTPLNTTGATADTDRLSALDIAAPTFAVPAAVDADETYEYLLTVSAENVDPATVEVTVTVLNKAALTLVCAGNPYSVYEGSEDITLDCAASGESGAPGALEGSDYEYTWTPLNTTGATADTDRLSALDISSPTFAVPDSVDADETYEYLLTVSADHADDATVEVTVTVLNRIVPPASEPVAFSGDPSTPEPVASSADPSALGVRVGVSSLRFGVQSSDVRVSLDPLSEQISTSVSGPHHAGRMMLSLDEALSLDGAEALALSIELVTPVTLRRMGDNMVYERMDRSADTATDPVTDKTAHEISENAANNATSRGAGIAATGIFGTSLDKKSDIQADTSMDKTAREISGSTGDNTADRSENKLVEIAANEIFGTIADKKGDRIPDTATDKTARKISDEAWDKVTAAPAVLSLSPSWSVAESCESLSSQAIGGLHTEVRLSEADCRLLLFGGELDLSGAIPGRYAGNMDVILRTASGEETHSIEVAVDVVPTQRVILAGAEGVRFAGPDEVSLRLTEGQNVRISPDVAYLTQEAPSGAFAFSNVSLIPQEISISARFGYAEATEDGRETLIEDPSRSPLGDLSALVDIYPRTLILMPGEEGVIRYGIREEALASLGAQNEEGLVLHGVRENTLASMEAPGEEELMRHGVRADTLASLMKSGYAAFFEVTSAPHQYVRTDQLPQAATAGRTAHVTMRIPGAYAPDERAPSLRAELISVSQGASPLATFLVETEGAPFFGEMVAYDGDGRELGRRQTLVYTRSRVRMPLTRTPEGETVFLRFISSGRSSGGSSGPSRISEPVSILWDAPQRVLREIGAASHNLKK